MGHFVETFFMLGQNTLHIGSEHFHNFLTTGHVKIVNHHIFKCKIYIHQIIVFKFCTPSSGLLTAMAEDSPISTSSTLVCEAGDGMINGMTSVGRSSSTSFTNPTLPPLQFQPQPKAHVMVLQQDCLSPFPCLALCDLTYESVLTQHEKCADKVF
jgi:hypothetical protein